MKALKAFLLFIAILAADPAFSREWWETGSDSQSAPQAAPRRVRNKNDGNNRIGRLGNLFDGKQVDKEYRGFEQPAYCTNTDYQNVIYCVTSDRGMYPKNAILTINLNQNLMFVVRGLDDESACTKRPLEIVAFYGDSKIANEKLIPLDRFAGTFDSYVGQYAAVMGCASGYNPGWEFNSSPFGFNMRFGMPWQNGHESAGFREASQLPNDESWK